MSTVQIPWTSSAYKIGAIRAGGIVLPGAENSAINTGTNKTMVYADGALGPRTSFISAMDPTIPFGSRNLDLLKMTGTRGKPVEEIGSGESQGLLEVFMELLKPNSTIYGGAKHMKFEANRGFLSPNSLTCETDDVFTMDFQLYVASPEQTWPLVAVTDQTLPNLEDITLYGIGAMFVNGLHVNSKSSVDLQFNPTVEPHRRDGNIYPECFYLTNFEPKLNVTLADLSYALAARLGRNGHADREVSGTQGTCLYLRRRRAGGEYYPNTDPVHMKLSFSGDYYFDQLAGGDSQSLSETTLTIDILQDENAAENEIQIQTDIAIPVEINPDDPA